MEEAQPLAPEAPVAPSPVSLAPEPAPDLAPETAEPTPPPVATPPEAEEPHEPPVPPPEPEPPAWAALSSEEEALAHEAFKPHLERLQVEATEKGKREGQSETERRLRPQLNQSIKELQGVGQHIGGIYQTLVDAVADGKLDADEARTLFRGSPEAWKAITGQQAKYGTYTGQHGLVLALAQASGDANLLAPFADRLTSTWETGIEDPTLAADVYETLQRKDREVQRAKWEKEEEPKIAERINRDIRAEKRAESPPPAKPQGGGGGGGLDTLAKIDEALRTGPTADIDDLLKRRAAFIE